MKDVSGKNWLHYSYDEILNIQKEKLQLFISYTYRNSPYYRRLWKSPPSVKNPSDLKYIPFTEPSLLIGDKSKDLLACSPERIRYIYCSGGTTDSPKVFYYTQNDWNRRIEYRSRCGVIRGLGFKDIVAMVLPYGIWGAGQSSQAAHEKLGSLVIPAGLRWNGLIDTFVLIQRLSATSMVTTPSVALVMGKILAEKGVDASENNLRVISTTGEDVLPPLRKELEKIWKAPISAMYASSEAVIGVECSQHDGYHVWSDDLIIEVVDEKDNPSPEGEQGEIVITCLFGEALPLIRYRLGDIVKFSWEPCKCGLPYPRVWFMGRKKNRFVVTGGVNVEPYQIKEAISKLPFRVFRYEIVLEDGEHGQDVITFRLETNSQSVEAKAEAYKIVNSLSIDWEDVVKDEFVAVKVELVSPGKLTHSEQTTKQLSMVVDKRRFPK